MKRIALSTAVVATMLAASGVRAQWALELKEKSYELTLQNVTLPASTAGTIIFRECDECDVRSMPVTAATRYFIGDSNVPFTDFKATAEDLRPNLGPTLAVGIYIHYDIKTSAINRIELSKFQFDH